MKKLHLLFSALCAASCRSPRIDAKILIMKKPHRIYTLFRNVAIATCPAGFGMLIGDGFVSALSGILLMVAALLAMLFPVRQDELIATPNKVFFGIFGSIGLLVLLGFVLAIGMIFAEVVMSGPVEVQCKTYPELCENRIARTLHVDAMIPPESCNIRFKVSGGGAFAELGRYAKFTCQTTESDFLKFASAHGYALETNRFVNVSPNNADKAGGDRQEGKCSASEPKFYLLYQYRHMRGNGGGITLEFNPATQILRGRYSSN